MLRQSYFNQIQDDPQISKKGGILTMNHFSNNFSHLWSNLYNFFAKLLNCCGPFSRHPSLERNLNLNKKIIFLLVIPKQMQNKFSFLSISEVGEKQWAEEEERRKKKVSENNGQLFLAKMAIYMHWHFIFSDTTFFFSIFVDIFCFIQLKKILFFLEEVAGFKLIFVFGWESFFLQFWVKFKIKNFFWRGGGGHVT